MARGSILAAAVAMIMGAGSGFGFAPGSMVATQVETPADRRAVRRATSSSRGIYGTKSAGITVAQQKRAAKKRRNVKRHKASCRG